MDLAQSARKQRHLLEEFESLHGGKDEALSDELSTEFFKSVFSSDFSRAEKLLEDLRRKK